MARRASRGPAGPSRRCHERGWRFYKDWLDIEGIAVRQAGCLGEALIWAELGPLLELKEAPDAAERLRALLDRARA